MKPVDLLILNLNEVRRRSRILWDSIPADKLEWRPEPGAMSAIELVRHVLEDDLFYALVIEHRGRLPETPSPFLNRPVTTVTEDVAFAEPHRARLLETVRQFSDEELRDGSIARPERGYVRRIGDFILRVAYHEAIHAGQLMVYLRLLGVDRPNVWD
jgi:uncharacterized damage-inducible protein DinB